MELFFLFSIFELYGYLVFLKLIYKFFRVYMKEKLKFYLFVLL